MPNRINDFDNSARTVEFDVINDMPLFQNYPTRFGYTFDFVSSRFMSLNALESIIIITYTPLDVPLPDFLSPANVNRNPNQVITCTWQYNAHGKYSDWGVLAFTIDTIPPEKPLIEAMFNTKYFAKLLIENTNYLSVFIYRAEGNSDDFKRIAKTNEGLYVDYTIAPGKRYKYFARAVDENYSYADSDITTVTLNFNETTIAEHDNPHNQLALLVNLNAKPKKTATHEFENVIVPIAGRDYPLSQTGRHKNKIIDYAFYCNENEKNHLLKLAESGKTLILRDKRHGVIYGTLGDTITVQPAQRNGYITTFTFTQTEVLI